VPAMRQVAGRLRLELAQFRELSAFAQFGSELDTATKAQLDRGLRLTELLKQPQHRTVPLEAEVLALFAGINGYLDDLPAERVRRFEEGLTEFARTTNPELMQTLATGARLTDEVQGQMRLLIDDFKATGIY